MQLLPFVSGAIIAIALPPPVQMRHPPHLLHQLTQCVYADNFHYNGCNYLVADRYSNRAIIERSSSYASGADGLITCLRRIFDTFGMSDELASDGDLEITLHVNSSRTGVYPCLSSL